ncbi:S9 family peptidase [Sphingosinicella sp. BN140058]|uniref:alpha/beta hydrolase family protein n=1 Tax=Sphingosinicella sp. BN140058 TaxID=1892855 RepID=UPI001013BC57|nr:S9 family peptidase [Sphingosinicella sp. BN140058]QAY77170.1 S9 family peptidase [Sphingosinicella sp. BN140058]
MTRRWLAAALSGAAMMLTIATGAAFAAPEKAGAAGKPVRIPTAELARTPLISAPALSPDGNLLLATLGTPRESVLGIIEPATGKITPFRLPDGWEIASYRWAGNGTVLISAGKTTPWLDDEAYMTRLLAYDVATAKTRFVGKREQGLEGDDILYVDPDGKWLLLSIQRTVYDWPSVYRVELDGDGFKQVVAPRTGIWEWYADTNGFVRAGTGIEGDKWVMVYRSPGANRFRYAGKARIDDVKASLGLLRFGLDSDKGYILSSEKTGRDAVYEFDYANLQTGALVFEAPENDVSDFTLKPDGTGIKAAYYTDVRDRVVWFDPERKEVQDAIDKAVGEKEAWIVSQSRDGQKMVVLVTGTNDPGTYYIFQNAAGVMQRLAMVNEKVRAYKLAASKPVAYTARDGLKIPAYLTLPNGREPKNLPLIIMPHGGPYGVRDRGDYDPEVQLLANRGYAVLQPNYRGSESYGRTFEDKGAGQWGRAMQDDLDDGMDWLVKQGIADPKRVCIVGSSYGGYAAMWGATRNPERYRCAASFAGVMDVPRQLKYSRDFFINAKSARKWKDRVRGEQSFNLNDISPIGQVSKLSVPVLVTHGDKDQRVPLKQSALYAKALEKAGKPFEYHVYPGEGHGLTNPDNRKDYFDRLEAFLAKHNPAD